MKETLLTIVCCLTALCAWAERPSDPVETPDSLEISLLTCEPHLPIYSLYGHTAIRVRVLPFELWSIRLQCLQFLPAFCLWTDGLQCWGRSIQFFQI